MWWTGKTGTGLPGFARHGRLIAVRKRDRTGPGRGQGQEEERNILALLLPASTEAIHNGHSRQHIPRKPRQCPYNGHYAKLAIPQQGSRPPQQFATRSCSRGPPCLGSETHRPSLTPITSLLMVTYVSNTVLERGK